MDAKEISAFLTPPKLTVREHLLLLTGASIALLLVAAGNSLYQRDYRAAVWCFVAAAILSFVFFRKRKIVLVISGLSCILAFGTLGFPFHPSLPGLALLLGSAGALYLTIRWQTKKYPHLSFRQMHALFAGEQAMAAENARIEAEARDLAKKRPYGPWLFR